MLPIVYAVGLEFKDVKYTHHLWVSTMTAAIVAVIFLIPALLAQFQVINPLDVYGITLPVEWSWFLVVIALVMNFFVYWLSVGITKFVEAIVPGT